MVLADVPPEQVEEIEARVEKAFATSRDRRYQTEGSGVPLIGMVA
jgi:hypothetical protein